MITKEDLAERIQEHGLAELSSEEIDEWGDPVILFTVVSEDNRIELLEKLNQDDKHSDVYKAKFISIDGQEQIVAAKFLSRPGSGSEKEFLQEFDMYVYDFLFSRTESNIVHECLLQELIQGKTLDHVISELSFDTTLQVTNFQQILCNTILSLVEVNQKKIIHGDCQPSNVFWNSTENRATFFDFGLARRSENNISEGHIYLRDIKLFMNKLIELLSQKPGSEEFQTLKTNLEQIKSFLDSYNGLDSDCEPISARVILELINENINNPVLIFSNISAQGEGGAGENEIIVSCSEHGNSSRLSPLL